MADEIDQFGMTWRCWDCSGGVQYEPADRPPWITATRYGSDTIPLQLPDIPDGCTAITMARWWEIQDEVQVARDVWWANYEATHPAGAVAVAAAAAKSEDDRISDLVAAKVAEALAARDTSV